MKRILPNLAFTAILLAGCGGSTSPVIPTSSGQAPDVSIVRLFDSTGGEVSSHIPLTEGKVDRIQVRLYGADGTPTTFIPGGVQLGFSFSPSSLAQAMPVDTLVWNVTPTAAIGTSGNLSITVKLLTANTTKPFGPFQVLIHPPPP